MLGRDFISCPPGTTFRVVHWHAVHEQTFFQGYAGEWICFFYYYYYLILLLQLHCIER